MYSKVWNKRTPWKKSGQKNERTPLNKHKYPLIRPYPQEKSPKINKRSTMLITDPSLASLKSLLRLNLGFPFLADEAVYNNHATLNFN